MQMQACFPTLLRMKYTLVQFLLKIFFTEMDETALLSKLTFSANIDFKPSDWYHNVLNSNFQCAWIIWLQRIGWASIIGSIKFHQLGGQS